MTSARDTIFFKRTSCNLVCEKHHLKKPPPTIDVSPSAKVDITLVANLRELRVSCNESSRGDILTNIKLNKKRISIKHSSWLNTSDIVHGSTNAIPCFIIWQVFLSGPSAKIQHFDWFLSGR